MKLTTIKRSDPEKIVYEFLFMVSIIGTRRFTVSDYYSKNLLIDNEININN